VTVELSCKKREGEDQLCWDLNLSGIIKLITMIILLLYLLTVAEKQDSD